MIAVKNIEVILGRLVDKPKHNGNMIQDTQAMYEETNESCTFEWIDERDKPVFTEIAAEFYVYCAEDGCPLCPDCCSWDLDQKEFVPDLKKERLRCLGLLSVKRKAVIDSGVTVDSVCLQSDDNAHGNMNGYISESIINGLVDVVWKCSDGTRHLYTVQDFKPVFKAITTFRRDCFVSEDTLATQIEASEVPASIDIESGWPSNTLVTI